MILIQVFLFQKFIEMQSNKSHRFRTTWQ